MEMLWDALRSWGADVDGALRRLMDDEMFYARLLEQFAGSEELKQLPALLDRGQHQEAYLCAHSLKGASANLGLTPLARVLSDITAELKKEEPDQKALEMMQEAYLQLKDSYQALMN